MQAFPKRRESVAVLRFETSHYPRSHNPKRRTEEGLRQLCKLGWLSARRARILLRVAQPGAMWGRGGVSMAPPVPACSPRHLDSPAEPANLPRS